MVDNEIMNDLFFPKLTFDNVKSIEKQLHFGARELRYYWMNAPHHLEYRWFFCITWHFIFDFINIFYQFHVIK